MSQILHETYADRSEIQISLGVQYFMGHLTQCQATSRASAAGGRGMGKQEERGWAHVALGRGRRRAAAPGWRRSALQGKVSLSPTSPSDAPRVLARKLPFEGAPFTVGRADLSSFLVRLRCDPGPEFRLKSLDGQSWFARIPAPASPTHRTPLGECDINHQIKKNNVTDPE